MRRSALAFTVALALVLPAALTADATGAGGWDHLGHGATSTTPSLNGTVSALNATEPGVLLVGGNFTSAGGVAHADRIAAWTGSTWRALPGIANGLVDAIAYKDGKVYAGGTFVNAGGKPTADFLAVWDGFQWKPFCNANAPAAPAITATVSALQIIGNTLYVGGAFANGGGLAAADFLLACDLTTGMPSATVANDGDINSGIYALTASSTGVLYAGGGFINLAGIPAADHVASFHLGVWQAMGSGPALGGGAVDSFVRSLVASGTTIYVGTDSVNVAGIARADHVARWNGSAWSAVGANTAGTNGWFPTTAFINALATFGSFVFAAGSFQNANGVSTADDIVYFDGSNWRPIGSDGVGNGPMIGNLTALGVFAGKVHAGGNFTSAGGDGMARSISSYALRLPDARIGGAASGPYVGNSVYSATAAGETRTIPLARGSTATFFVNVQNDGLVSAAFTIKCSAGASGYTVHIFNGATNITAAVLAGTYLTGVLPARGSTTLTVRVTRGAVSATAATYLVRASSSSGAPPDAVMALVKGV